MTHAAPILDVEALVAGYERGAPIVNGVSITADRGEIVVVLGPNGAGKSTLIKAIAGLVPVASGRIRLAGDDITARPAHTMVRSGLAFVPQTKNVFTTLSVADNLKLAARTLASAERADASLTFLIWTMLVVGGSGNNLVALLGAGLVSSIWSASGLATGVLFAPEDQARAAALRNVAIGVLLAATIVLRPRGLIGERLDVSRHVESRASATRRRPPSPDAKPNL